MGHGGRRQQRDIVALHEGSRRHVRGLPGELAWRFVAPARGRAADGISQGLALKPAARPDRSARFENLRIVTHIHMATGLDGASSMTAGFASPGGAMAGPAKRAGGRCGAASRSCATKHRPAAPLCRHNGEPRRGARASVR